MSEQLLAPAETAPPAPAIPPVPVDSPAPHPTPAGPPAARHVYAIGRIEPRFSSLGLEKEFAQATGRAVTAGLTDRQVVHSVLADSAHRYLVRKLRWVLSIEGQETYLLAPQEPADLDMLVDAVRPVPGNDDIDVVIGVLGPLAPADYCNGLVVPLVAPHQIYSFDTDALLSAIPRPEKLKGAGFRAASQELFTRIQQLADNAGATDEHRALNYLAVRYPAIYAHAAEKFAAAASLTGVDIIPSRLSGVRTLVNVVFTFTDRATGVDDKAAVKVDVTEEFPFLVGNLAPYIEK